MADPALLIQNGDVYAPEPLGKTSVLLIHGKIAAISPCLDPRDLKKLGIPFQVIDASSCVVTPGAIDPHEHLAGGSGEGGFSTQTPNIHLCEIVESGITTVVGCLGVDTITQNMTHLLGRVKALNEEGITAFLFTGGYDFPPATITGSVRSDIMLIDEVIGAGEIAISDKRSAKPDPQELARLVFNTYTGGLLTKKAGVCHFHLGEGKDELLFLRKLIDDFAVLPEALYPTHIEKTNELIREAAKLSRQGVTVDMDTEAGGIIEAIERFVKNRGDLNLLTLSSDAASGSPKTLTDQFRKCVLESDFKLEALLPLITTNTARVLKFPNKGRIKAGFDGDLVIHNKKTFTIRDVIANGTLFVRNGKPVKEATFLETSTRRFEFKGKKSFAD